jgi:hypothetical protein
MSPLDNSRAIDRAGDVIMRHPWAWLALFLAVPAQASPLTESAEQRELAPEDRQRLAERLYEHSRIHPIGTWTLIREQQEVSQELLDELYSPSPNLERIERLDLRVRELNRVLSRGIEETTTAFYRRLNPDDRLNLMKMNYPLPARDSGEPAAP